MLYPARLTRVATDHPDVLAALLCGILVLLGWSALHFNWLGLALFLLPAAYVIGGFESAREGLTTLLQEKELDVDLLMIVAALGAAFLGLWRQEYYLMVDGAILILIFAISGALEGYAMQRTERSIRGLMSLTADTARVVVDGQERTLPISELQVGDRIRIRPGELIPTDAVIVEGETALNEAAITGESLPVEKTIGDQVFAGTLNGYGALLLKVHQPPESSLLQRIIRVVEQAQTEKPKSQQFIERFERGYARVVVLVGILLAILPPFCWEWSWETTIYRALIFLVVASPCALVAAIMPTLLSGIANGARQGILFKSGAQLELIGKVRAIAFDKTGTLTTGNPQVYKVIPAEGYTEADVVNLAAALEAYSEHPIGQAICQYATNVLPTTDVSVSSVQAQPGRGITGLRGTVPVCVGKASFVQSRVQTVPTDLLTHTNYLEQDGKTVAWVAEAGSVVGLIAIADTLRPEATVAIAQLKRMGVEAIVMLTGDNQQTANSVARSIGIDHVYAELLPEEKLQFIQKLQQQYQTVAMVGDGINDAPALAQATVGIAMGAAGSDVALETADIVLMTDRLEKIVAAICLGQRSQTVVKQNIAFALSFILLLITANFIGNITLPLGVIGHEGSTVLVILSGLRLLSN
ncbi:heavy metal translocating P-type ATPase [Alkalinema pantanalense CENA528]|uniref:heavy metal translocating P-type ATPase n=1 Tax=Alkalinema pantanalense TaxID=1620705 RepID=UPI003D70124E